MDESHVPKVEMLWESCDPHSALNERFRMRDAASAARWVAASVSDRWGIHVDSCERIVMSDTNALAWIASPSGQLLAKWSVAPERFTRLAQVARLTQWLEGKGRPVSAPVQSLAGEPQVEVDHISICLQRVIPGELLDVSDRDQVQAAGTELAHLHQTLESYPDADLVIPSRARPSPLAARVIDWVKSAGNHVPRAARDTLMRLVADAPAEDLPSQLVHGDYRSSNVLCAGSTVAAVIDFEEARVDHCVDELARSAIMLGTRYRNWGPVSADVRATFLSGYRSVRQLTTLEEGWLDLLLLWYAFALVPPGDDPTGWGPAALDHLGQYCGSA